MPTITVRDILRLALPPESYVVAGAAGMQAPVTWVVTMRTRLPAFVDLRGGEIALLSVEAALQLDPHLTLKVLVQRLAQAPVGAVAVQGTITQEDIEAANAVRLPLIHLPDNWNLREIEREITRLFGDYEAQVERRGAQLYNVLTQRSLSDNALVEVLETLADWTGQCVACYATNGDLTMQVGQGAGRVALQALRPNARGDSSLPGQQIWVEPIGTTEHPGGYLAMAGTTLDEWDRLAARQGAAALALVFARQQAVQAAEERLRGDFLSLVLAGPPADPTALVQRGEELGYNLALPYVALLLHLENTSAAMQSRLLSSIQSELTRRGIVAPVQRREKGILCMIPLGDNSGTIRPRELAESLRERLSREYDSLMVAMGTPANTLFDWTHTLREAEQALALGQQLHLFNTHRVLAFSDLGIYRLLILLRDEPEMWTFYRETLASLVSYDRKHGGELLKTLEEYFNHLGNLRATSEALHVHRNTLLYRLERIQQISGMNLEDAEEYFALWLGLRIHHVLSTTEMQLGKAS